MIALLAKSTAALVAVAGLALSVDDADLNAYSQETATTLTADAVTVHAANLFARADADKSGALSVDEYTAMSIVTAELARLNGFIVLETRDEPTLISLPGGARSLTQAEQTLIAAKAASQFYAGAGADASLSTEEFTQLYLSDFADADLNGNQRLGRRELLVFANKTARLSSEV